jgi:class 3 adenylate cyclase
MPSTEVKRLNKSVSRQIRRSRKPVTILFTDIEGSTRYWDLHGDVEGRLMIDLHNRLIYPVIRRHRGKVIKNIGDAIMASFKSPKNALKAAIGIQQILERQRTADESFQLKVRIGVHTGKALVENDDVFGDAVNVAARVESYGEGNEICLSNDTASKLGKLAFGLEEKGSFVPRGKSSEVTIYRCEWEKYPSMIKGVKENPLLQVVMRQKLELLLYSVAALCTFYLLFLKYLRFALADWESLALITLNVQLALQSHIFIPIAVMIVIIAAVIFLTHLRPIPRFTLNLLKGGFGFTVAFLLFFLPTHYLPTDNRLKLNETLYESHHLFVEVLEDNTKVLEMPRDSSAVIRTVNAGAILLLSDVTTKGGMKWNKVLVGGEKYGWIPRIVPAKIGIPQKRLSITNKFYFRYRDLYALALGVIGFIWGVLSLRIRPA